MTISIWRYSHLTLAISSFVFIVLAALTGIILALEPIYVKQHGYDVGKQELSLAKVLPVLTETYDEVLSLQVDENNFVKVSVITNEGNEATFYVDPNTGQKIGDIIEKPPFFKFVTNLHRSLFLKSTGRFLVGFASFLLFLIAISGVLLIFKQGKGVRAFFGKTEKLHQEQYYHTVVGKWNLIFVVLLSLTGVFLSLKRFSVLKEARIKHQIVEAKLHQNNKMDIAKFPIFKDILLYDVVQLEFPFSSDVEDYFTVTLQKRELLINQFNGEILSEKPIGAITRLMYYSKVLHTGSGSIIWSVLLLLATLGILFFVYSGFVIMFKRRSALVRNTWKKEDAEYIILVGSENGHTWQHARMLYEALLKANQKVYVSALNQYGTYSKARHLVVLTSTYGVGESPSNATKFMTKFEKNPVKNASFSVVGYGSLAYENYCQFAYEVDALLQKSQEIQQLLPICTIHNSSFETFASWVNEWQKEVKLELYLEKPIPKKRPQTINFSVVENTQATPITNETFLLTLAPEKHCKFKSGDLLAIYPNEEERERLYSIGTNAGNSQVVLSIKKHEKGVCSNYLHGLSCGDELEAVVQKNTEFHFPKKKTKVVLIANGTGIAPYLGMLQNNTQRIETHLFWGGRTLASYELYKGIIDDCLRKGKLTQEHLAFSRETSVKVYVQDLVQQQIKEVVKILDSKGFVFICGSVNMQKEVLEVLKKGCELYSGKTLLYYQKKGRVKMDCY